MRVIYMWEFKLRRLDAQIDECQVKLNGSLSQTERRKLNIKLDTLLDERY
jgi:hypothetical protein